MYFDQTKQYNELGWVYVDQYSSTRNKRDCGHSDVHSNTIEINFSTFKRGMTGVYLHFEKKHLHRFAIEFELRYSARIANEFNVTDRNLNIPCMLRQEFDTLMGQ